jgi:hypothetical protein
MGMIQFAPITGNNALVVIQNEAINKRNSEFI